MCGRTVDRADDQWSTESQLGGSHETGIVPKGSGNGAFHAYVDVVPWSQLHDHFVRSAGCADGSGCGTGMRSMLANPVP